MLQEGFHVSERRACRLVGQPRGTQRYLPTQAADEDALTQAIIALAAEYGRYGYRRITALLNEAGWSVGKDRVQRIWRREGLKVPGKQKPGGGCGSATTPAYGCAPAMHSMSGRMILSIMPPMTGAPCGC